MQIQAFRFTQQHQLKTNIKKGQIEHYQRMLDTMNTVSPEQFRPLMITQLRAFFRQSAVNDMALPKEQKNAETIAVADKENTD